MTRCCEEREWIDVTRLGDAKRQLICGTCSATKTEPFPEVSLDPPTQEDLARVYRIARESRA